MHSNKIFKLKFYQHIDKRIANIKDIESKVKDKSFIESHGFYPFLSYTKTMKKFSKEPDKKTYHHWTTKDRPIKYASHIDRCIYQWYSYNINNYYNEYCLNKNLNEVSIAYRTCLKGMTNIEFAAKAINFIKDNNPCYIIISDFSKFFDFISHDKLKENLCKVLKVKKLEKDYYKVFKSMTKYSYIEKETIENFLICNKIETKESLKKRNSLFDNISWKVAKKKLKKYIQTNNKNYGIPQGSPLSGVFANIYMIDFDAKVNNYVRNKKGLYMRYSDDLIVIIPKKEVSSINKVWDFLQNVKNEYPTLTMSPEKTSCYIYENNKIKSLHNKIDGIKKNNNYISFLGFSFDGNFVKFRDKTLTKFFYKLYRKIDYMMDREDKRIKKGKKKRSKIDKHMILKELNLSKTENRKFIDYVNRAKRNFPNEKYIINFKANIKNKIFQRFNKSNKNCNKK